MNEDVVKRRVQPRLRGFAEFFGRAQTVTGDLWWEEERMDDGTVRRTPLMPITPACSCERPGLGWGGRRG
jgi:hypothetical protein